LNPLSKIFPRNTVSAAILCALAACAGPGGEPTQIADPFEPVNRYIFAANLALDTTLIEPVANIYRDIVPDPARDGVRNFLRNLESPVLLANNVLQRDIDAAGVTTKRFFINTTVGILGLFDPAANMGLARRDEDFGQTMGTYGVGPGVYLVLPILGPSSLRDAAGNFVDYYFDPLNYYTDNTHQREITFLRAGIRGIDTRARVIETLDEIERTSIDFYATIRSLYHQRRQSEIRNGSAPSLPKLDLSSDVDEDRIASLKN
jgi:phospholipid-binding lipoprotein MlaA